MAFLAGREQGLVYSDGREGNKPSPVSTASAEIIVGKLQKGKLAAEVREMAGSCRAEGGQEAKGGAG